MNFIKIALLFSFLIFAGTAHAEECPKAKDSLQNLTGAAAAILKQTQIDAVKKDPRDFCQRNMLLRGLNANGAAPADVAKISTEDLKKDYAGKISAHSPWDLTLIPTKETRSSGVKELSDIFPNLQSEFSSPHHEKSLNCPPDSLPFSEIKGSPPICKTMPATKIPDVGNAKKFVACAEVSIWNSRGCATGLSILEKEMAPHGDQSLTFMPLSLWNRVLGQSKYDEGLRLATLTIMNRANGTSLDKNANIFSDLQNAFRKSGLSIKESTDASFYSGSHRQRFLQSSNTNRRTRCFKSED